MLNMSLTLSDIITIVVGLGGFISIYVFIRNSLVRMQTNNLHRDKEFVRVEKEVIKLTAQLEREKEKRDIDNKELWTKLISIENGQVEMNTYLKENLKHMVQLLDSHENSIININKILSK